MKTFLTSACCLAILVFLGSCSSSQETETTVNDEPVETGETEVDDGMAVEGIRGTLRRDEVDPILNNAALQFQQCYAEALDEHPYLAGDLGMQFTVAPDGSVRSVWVNSATIGSVNVQQCILNIARNLTFPEPHGGQDADFRYGPLIMSSDDGFPFQIWEHEQIAEQLELGGESLSACTNGSGGFQANFYIGPGGQVLSIGVVPPSIDQQEAARCIERELSNITFPDPGEGTVAKVSLEI